MCFYQTLLSCIGPSITLSHSSAQTIPVFNGSNYTLYQEFVTDGNVSELSITWMRSPQLDPTTVRKEEHVINNRTLSASLIIWNILQTARYTVTASNGCGMNNTKVFHIQVHYCAEYEKPEPRTQYELMVIPEPELPNMLHLCVKFLGSSDTNYLTLWSFQNNHCLELSQPTPQINCSRFRLPQCRFEAHLWIANVTYKNSTSYTVVGMDDYGDEGNNSTIELCT